MKFNPLSPMEAQSVRELPKGPEWQYEPKWDGFRCIAFRKGEAVLLQSKSQKPLTRYFPEIVQALLAIPVKQFILDGELVIPAPKSFDFDLLLQRIHPAESRIKKLSDQTPATFITFDLLMDQNGAYMVKRPLLERRKKLEVFAKKFLKGNKSLILSPTTIDLKSAFVWRTEKHGFVDGLIAKRIDLDYRSDDRTGMKKFKWRQTADCVIGGFRFASKGKDVGSLLLGLYDDKGLLNHVGFCSGIKTSERSEITKKLSKLISPPGFTGKAPDGQSRWSTKRTEEWIPLKPLLVVEVEYDHVSNSRFRHGTTLLRWRLEKDPKKCTFDQLGLVKAGAKREVS